MSPTLATTCALVLATAAGVTAQLPQSPIEARNFEGYTSHEDMMEYLLAVRANSTDMRLSSYGETREGRELPYAIFSRPLISQPWEAALLGKPIVMLAANVHGGERTLRESLLMLVRQLATPGTPENQLLDDLVILVAPQINPDGFHAEPRATRGNAWGIDLNRDYVKLEHPEIASYVGNMINEWHPHIFVDGHNGGAFPYNINYQCPSHASPDPAITALCDRELFPFVENAMRANGYKTWYYQNGNERRWNTGGFQARIGRNYGGFINSIGVLFESPPSQSQEEGARSGLVAFKATLDFVKQNAARVTQVVHAARMEALRQGLAAEGEVVVQQRYGPEDYQVTYEIRGEGNTTRTIVSDSLMKKPIPTLTRERPYAYLVPREAVDAIEMLRRHGITVERLEEPAQLTVQAYTVGGIDYTRQYDHAAAVEITVGEVTTVERTFPTGTYVVLTGQVLGRLVAHMLEPETDDNVIYWNTMDAWLPRPSTGAPARQADPDDDEPPPGRQQQSAPLVPIYKLMTPTALPTRIIE